MSDYQLMAAAAVFITVAFGAGWVASRVLDRLSPVRRRLARLGQPPPPTPVLVGAGAVAGEDPADRWKRVERLLARSPKELGRLRRRLVAAGLRGPAAAPLFIIAEYTLPIVAVLGTVIVLSGLQALIASAVLGLVAFLLPGLWLERTTDRRRRAIRNGLPDALDLMVVCLEAGSSLDQAIVRTSAELSLAYPDLAFELDSVVTETRAGRPRVEALRNLAERTKLDEARALVTMLVQTERFGTSIAQALRVHADSVRTRRRQNAEERAAKVGVKLVFPLVLLLFPALYVVILGSAVLDFLRVFG